MAEMQNKLLMATGSPFCGLNVLEACFRLAGLNSIDDAVQCDTHSIHRLLFQDLGCPPNLPNPLPEGWQDSKHGKTAKDRIRKLMAYMCDPHETRYVIDTYLGRVFPLWLDLLDELRVLPLIVHVVRPPYEVAASLNHATGKDLLNGHLLWVAYIKEIDSAINNRKHTTITFDQLLADPISTLNILESTLNFEYPKRPLGIRQNLLDVVQPKLKRNNVGNANYTELIKFDPFFQIFQNIRKTITIGADVKRECKIFLKSSERKGEKAALNDCGIMEDAPEIIGKYEIEQKTAIENTLTSRLLASSCKYDTMNATLLLRDRVNAGEDPSTQRIPLLSDQWQNINFDIPSLKTSDDGILHFCPLDRTGAVSISTIRLINRANGSVRWTAPLNDSDAKVTFHGDLVRLPDPEHLVLLITGPSPCISLCWSSELNDIPLRLEVWIKPSQNQQVLPNNRLCAPAVKRWRILSFPGPRKKDAGVYMRHRICKISDTNDNPKSDINVDRKQIIVLGMHRSGTSAITRSLQAMGAYVGEEEKLTGKSWENPHGFFERRDARRICDNLLQKSNADWWKIRSFDVKQIEEQLVAEQEELIRVLIDELDHKSIWALKEPRLCLLLPIWESFLYRPVVVYVYRNPVEVARSLRQRNGFNMHAGIALWEAYNKRALSCARRHDCIFVNYGTLIDQPRETVEMMANGLRELGVAGIGINQGVAAVGVALHRQQSRWNESLLYLNEDQHYLWDMLCGRALPTDDELKISDETNLVLKEFEVDEQSRIESRAELRSLQNALKRREAEIEKLKKQ